MPGNGGRGILVLFFFFSCLLSLAGVWLNDLVQVAAHEIGHALGLWHSRDARALMHPNATYSRTWRIGQDDVWAIQRLYGEEHTWQAVPNQ